MTSISENKRIAKNTLFLYIRMAVLLVVGLYSSRVTLIALGVSDYGIYNVVGGVVTMFVFINYAMVNSTQRYITYELGKGDLHRLSVIFSTSFRIHVIISLIIVLLAETIGTWFLYNKMVIPEERMFAASWIFQFSIVSCVLTIITAPFNALIIAHEKMSAFAYISLMDAFLKLGIVLFLLRYNGDRLILYGVLLLLIAFSNFLVYLLYCRNKFPESKQWKASDRPLMIEMTKFAGWNLLGNFSYICYTQGLNLLLNVFFNPVVNAARGIAVQIQNIVSNFSYNVENAIKPQITKSYANNDMKRMLSLMSISARMSFFVLWFVSLPLILEANQVLNIWLAEVPDHTANFVRLTLLVLLTDSLTGPLLTAAQSTGNIKKYQLTVSLLCLSILPLSYIALRIMLMPELVFIVTLIVFMFTQIIKLKVVGEILTFSRWLYFKDVFLRAIGVALLSSILPLIIWTFNEPSFKRLILVLGVSVLFVPIVIYCIGINNNERNFLNTKIYGLLNNRSKKY